MNYATDWGRIFQSFLDWLFTFLKKKNISRSDFWQFQKQIPNDFISFQLQLKDTLCVLSFVVKKKKKSIPISILKKDEVLFQFTWVFHCRSAVLREM